MTISERTSPQGAGAGGGGIFLDRGRAAAEPRFWSPAVFLDQVYFLEHGRWALPDPADPGWGHIFSSEFERPHNDRPKRSVVIV